MKIVNARVVFAVGIVCVTVAQAAVPYIAFRSQGINGARELVGWQAHINRFDMDRMYGSFSVTPEYTRSFFPYKIAQCLFAGALINDSCCKDYFDVPMTCCCACPSLLIQGTKVADRNPYALMAENFYLPTDFSSKITFKPWIENFLVDFNLYVGMDEWLEGLYCRIHTPLCYTRWHLNYAEKVFNSGVNNYDPGYFNDTYYPQGQWTDQYAFGINRNQMPFNFTEYACEGRSIEPSPGSSIVYQGLAQARMSSCWRSKTRLAEVTAVCGWNFLLTECGYCGFNIRAAAPTGNRPAGVYLFEPIVGNGHHWELGGGIDAHYRLWCNQTEDEQIDLYIESYATHLFKDRQCRTFDLIDKPLSRYMLACLMTSDVENLQAITSYDQATGDFTAAVPDLQFNNEFAPISNITTIPVDVSYAVQGELIIKFAYTYCDWQWDLGYDLWGRSCSKISLVDNLCTPINKRAMGA